MLTPRRRVAITLAVVVLLAGLHGGLFLAWLRASPAPLITPHASDLVALTHTHTLTGRGDMRALTAYPLGAEDCSDPGSPRLDQARGTLRSRGGSGNDTPIHYVVASLPALVLGVSPTTVRAGTLALLALLAAATFGAGRAFGDHWTALAAAAMVTALPITVGASQTLFPTLGCMTGPALALAMLLLSDRFRRPGLALLAGVACALTLRWGEGFNDGMRSASVLVGPVLVLAVAGLARGEGRWRALLGLVLFCAVAAVVVDWSTVMTGRERLLEQAMDSEGGGFGVGLVSYLWELRGRLLGLPGCVLLGAGTLLLVRVKPRPEALALLLALVLPLVLLSLSAKRASYYPAVAAAPIALITALGLAAVPRIGRWLTWGGAVWLLAGAMALWLVRPDSSARKQSAGAWEPLLALDTHGRRPRPPSWLDITHDIEVVRLPLDPDDDVRGATALWLADEPAATILSALPDDSLVAVQAWQMPHGDVAAFTIQSHHPRLRVVSVLPPQQPKGCAEPVLGVSLRTPMNRSPRPSWSSRWQRVAASDWIELWAPEDQ